MDDDRPSKTEIFTGKVTGISFQVLDIVTALPPADRTEDRDRYLYTVYHIDIIASYKGDLRGSTQARTRGGLEDYRVEEQLRVIKEMNAWPNDGIPIQEGLPDIQIGEIYLFVTGQYETGAPALINLSQSVYNLRNPFEKHYASPGDEEYAITAKDIISTFGQDKWDDFWTEWKSDNPDWESWID